MILKKDFISGFNLALNCWILHVYMEKDWRFYFTDFWKTAEFANISNYTVFRSDMVEVISSNDCSIWNIQPYCSIYALFSNLQVVIFMTHTTNYAKDRVALLLFKHLFEFIYQWTNLQLRTERPTVMAEMYFTLFPKERYPLWTVSFIQQPK